MTDGYRVDVVQVLADAGEVDGSFNGMCFTTSTANALRGGFCHTWYGDGTTAGRIAFEGH